MPKHVYLVVYGWGSALTMHGSTGGTALERQAGEVAKCGNPHACLAAPSLLTFPESTDYSSPILQVHPWARFAFPQMHMFQ